MKALSYINRATSVLGRKPLLDFYYRTLEDQCSAHWKEFNFTPGNYYEFGTGNGSSLILFLKALRLYIRETNNKEYRSRIFLFDSFQGLPDFNGNRDYNPNWKKGMFSGTEDSIKNIVKKYGFLDYLTLTKGFFESTLSTSLRQKCSTAPPSIINIDVDFYTSTKTVLNWIYPILQDGTILHFDDVWEYLGNQKKGEILAISEFNDEYGGCLVPYHKHGIPSLQGKIFIFNRSK